MCDNLPENTHSKLANKGERIKTCRFPSGSIELVSLNNPGVAICLAYWTKLQILSSEASDKVSDGMEVIFFPKSPEPGAAEYRRDSIRIKKTGVEMTLQELGADIEFEVITGPGMSF